MDHTYGVGWGTLMLINAGLAQGKGRGGLVWFLLSIILGPIATLLIVLLPPIKPAQDFDLALPPPREGTREDIAPQD
jgi:hypothetical protein